MRSWVGVLLAMVGLLAGCQLETSVPSEGSEAASIVPPWQAQPLEELDITQLNERAAFAIREQRLFAPAGNNAVEYTLALFKRDAGNAALHIQRLRELRPYVAEALQRAQQTKDEVESDRLNGLLAAIPE